jgi:hypothetical protein
MWRNTVLTPPKGEPTLFGLLQRGSRANILRYLLDINDSKQACDVVNEVYCNTTPLMIASYHDDPVVIMMLISLGARTDRILATPNQSGTRSVLDIAIAGGKTNMISLLFTFGNLNVTVDLKLECLKRALIDGNTKMIQLFTGKFTMNDIGKHITADHIHQFTLLAARKSADILKLWFDWVNVNKITPETIRAMICIAFEFEDVEVISLLRNLKLCHEKENITIQECMMKLYKARKLTTIEKFFQIGIECTETFQDKITKRSWGDLAKMIIKCDIRSKQQHVLVACAAFYPRLLPVMISFASARDLIYGSPYIDLIFTSKVQHKELALKITLNHPHFPRLNIQETKTAFMNLIGDNDREACKMLLSSDKISADPTPTGDEDIVLEFIGHSWIPELFMALDYGFNINKSIRDRHPLRLIGDNFELVDAIISHRSFIFIEVVQEIMAGIVYPNNRHILTRWLYECT